MTVETLSALADALDADDDAAVLETFWDFEDAVGSIVLDERRFDRLATAVRYVASPDSQAFRESNSYMKSSVALGEAREEVSRAVLEYLTADRPASDAHELVAAAIDTDEANRRRRADLQSAGRAAGVPAVLAFTGIGDVSVPVGTPLTVTTRLSNLGSEAARSVTLGVSDVFDSEIDPTFIDSVGPGGSRPVDLTVAPASTGSAVVTATAATDRTGDTVSVGVEALDALGYIARARRRVQAMMEVVASRGTGRRGGPSVERQLDRVVEKLDSAADAIEGDAPPGSVDGLLGAAINGLDAVGNRLSGDTDTGLDQVTRIELREEIEATVETIRNAIDAA